MMPHGPGWTDVRGWDHPLYYETIFSGDLDGDGTDEVIARGFGGIVAYSYDAAAETWMRLADGPVWSDEGGSGKAQYYETIHSADLDGDGVAAYSYDGKTNTWSGFPDGLGWSNSSGWDSAKYYRTIQAVNVGSRDGARAQKCNIADMPGPEAADVVMAGRFTRGIVTARYDAVTSEWGSAARPYPEFTGDGLKAYNHISEGLGIDVPIRAIYGTATAVLLGEYQTAMANLERPNGIHERITGDAGRPDEAEARGPLPHMPGRSCRPRPVAPRRTAWNGP